MGFAELAAAATLLTEAELLVAISAPTKFVLIRHG
jgi:hypothetical protein